MRLIYIVIILSLLFIVSGCNDNPETLSASVPVQASFSVEDREILLPKPQQDSDVSIEESLQQRRSTRSYTDEPLILAEVSQLLWAAQGTTDSRGYRTAPSAGALYPLELYVVAGNVEGLEAGIYRYESARNILNLLISGDYRDELSDAALSQSSVANGAIAIVFTAIYERTTIKYGERGIRYVHIELGHATQNLCLQAVSMDLGVVTVGAFTDEKVAEILDLPDDEKPLYIIPVGRK